MAACVRCGHPHDDMLSGAGPLCLTCAADAELPAPVAPDPLAAWVVGGAGCAATWAFTAFAVLGGLPEMLGEVVLYASTLVLVAAIVLATTPVRLALGRLSRPRGLSLLALGVVMLGAELPLIAWVLLTQPWRLVGL